MPRKTDDAQPGVEPLPGASMRPRPDAAENARQPGSLDPRALRFNEAAARCRGKRPHALEHQEEARPASMRPRPDAAENRQAALSIARGNGLQ